MPGTGLAREHSNQNGNIVPNINDTTDTALIVSLKTLEYDIRRSITLREDLEDDVDPALRGAAARCGISVDNLHSKGDLLTAVQTAVRAAQARTA